MRGDLKISPWRLIRAQHETYVSARNNKARLRDYLLFDGTPLAVGGLCAWRSVKLSSAASGALLTASLLLSALLFGVMLQITQRAVDWAHDPPAQGKETTEHALFLRELAANAGYASLVCVAASIAFVVATTTGHIKLVIASAVGLALGEHLILVLLMVMKRVFALTEERLNRVRTGAAEQKCLCPMSGLVPAVVAGDSISKSSHAARAAARSIDRRCPARTSAICRANDGDTAFPICLATDVIGWCSGNTKSSGNVMQRAASRTVIGRCSFG